MLTGFEHITASLNKDELRLVPLLVKGFKGHGAANPITGKMIVSKTNAYLKSKNIKYRLSEPRLRKCCNYIRTKGLIPLIATTKGYYVSYNKDEIKNQIQSLNQRAISIKVCADGLQKFLT